MYRKNILLVLVITAFLLNIKDSNIYLTKYFALGIEDIEEPVENNKENKEDIFDIKIINVLHNFSSEFYNSRKHKYDFEYLLHLLSDPTRCIHAVPPNIIC